MTSGNPPGPSQQIIPPPQIYNGNRKRRAAPSIHVRQLEKALDMKLFCEQLKQLIDQPIKLV
jgi:hypothetical protein